VSGIPHLNVGCNPTHTETGHRGRQLLVTDEENWRCVGTDVNTRHPESLKDDIRVSRWTRDTTEDLEISCESRNDWYTIGIALKPTSLAFRSGATAFEGRIRRGATQVTAPEHSAHAVFRDACDVLHLHIPQSVLARHHEACFGQPFSADLAIDSEILAHDAILEQLSMALCHTQFSDTRFATLYVDGICLAMVAHLLERQFAPGLQLSPQDGNMPVWRLRRALDYIEMHLATPIRLADIAASAGLSRMPFAAQFRRATGCSPYSYLLRRRIERAQALLRHSSKSILDIATDTGFNSQSSLTTAFRRLTGETPHRWRTRT
jgi:AraC family transcriptional regulator